jgi:hypothetical protein
VCASSGSVPPSGLRWLNACPQLTAFFTSAAILASAVAVNSLNAKEVGHVAPSSRFASSLKPNVAYLDLNFIVHLHHGHAAQALERLGTEAGEPNKWLSWIWIWLHWHVALRAEAAVLARDAHASRHVASARTIVAGNPVTGTIVQRAAALLDDDRERLLATAAAFDAAGCPYQRARTLTLAGAEPATTGNAILADLGLIPTNATADAWARPRAWTCQLLLGPGSVPECRYMGIELFGRRYCFSPGGQLRCAGGGSPVSAGRGRHRRDGSADPPADGPQHATERRRPSPSLRS